MIVVPGRIEWEVWRIVASNRMSVSLFEIETQWTILDLAIAHDVLDLYPACDS